MSRVIFKYQMSEKDILSIPREHQFLKVDMQGGRITFWCSVKLDSETIDVPISVIGTGREFEGDLPRHLGTVFEGPFVWHIFGDLK